MLRHGKSIGHGEEGPSWNEPSAVTPAEPFLTAALETRFVALDLGEAQNLSRQLAGRVDAAGFKLRFRLLDESFDPRLQVRGNVIETHFFITHGRS
jgi:hypothetical protein